MVVIILTPIALMVGKESQGFFFSNWAVSEKKAGCENLDVPARVC